MNNQLNVRSFVKLDGTLNYLLILFLFFNFISRDISNIILILILFLSIYGIYVKRIRLSRQDYRYLLGSFIFVIFLLMNTNLTDGNIHEIDNYSRLLLLIPLVIFFRTSLDAPLNIVTTCQICILISFVFLMINHYPSDERYLGTASSSITYGNIIMTLIVVLIYNIFKERQALSILINIVIILMGFIVWSETLTRGSLAGLLPCFVYIAYLYRHRIKTLITLFIFILVFILNSSISDRIFNTYQNINSVISFELQNSTVENRSENQRVAYIIYAIKQIQEKPFFGSGASNIQEPMRVYFRSSGFLVAESDHLHNEYLDILVKFGVIGLILFFFIIYAMYMYIKKSESIFYRDLCCLLLLSQMGFMIFQSQFAHHQAITFFLVLLNYCLAQSGKRTNNKTV